MKIRSMEEKDLEQVIKIETDLFSDPWKKEDFLLGVREETFIYIVIEENEEILGYCGLWGIAGEGQINNVAIKKEYQGKKLGFAMLSYLLEEGKQLGLEQFTLEVRVSNKSAFYLYKKLGFKEEGIRKNFYREPREDAYIMWLRS